MVLFAWAASVWVMVLLMSTHNIISPTQYAFRPKSSTTLALQTVIDQLHQDIKAKQPTLAVYIDLSKAYDTISHEKLLRKLEHDFNFTPDTTSFFRSYFKNRQQSTHTQHAQSTMKTITHGIPQGSTLHHILPQTSSTSTTSSKQYPAQQSIHMQTTPPSSSQLNRNSGI